MTSLARVWTTINLGEADCVAALLELHGIRAFIENERSFWCIGFPTPLIPLGILVSEDESKEARDVLQDLLIGKREDCGRYFGLTREEEERLSFLVSNERVGRRLAWWWVVLLYATETLLLYAIVEGISRLRRTVTGR